MGRRLRICYFAFTLAAALVAQAPAEVGAQWWEDLYSGVAPDLAPGPDLKAVADKDDRYAAGTDRYPAAGDVDVSREGPGSFQSGYLSSSGELRFTEGRECDWLNPVCVGRMGIAERDGAWGSRVDPLAVPAQYGLSASADGGHSGVAGN